MQALNKYNRLVVLGKPGCGKTTLFKFFSLMYSGNLKNIQPHKDDIYFPVLLILREYQNERFDLKKFIVKKLEICGFPHSDLFIEKMLNNGKVILMLDGLDEITSKNAEKCKRQLFEITARYPDNKILISCRTAAFNETFETFVEVEIEDFDEPNKSKFIQNWFKSNKKADVLVRMIKKQLRLSELSQNPLLLSLICLLYERNLDIPKNKVELYEKCIETMLREWDISRGFRRITKYEKLSDSRKIKLFSYIAYHFYNKGEKIFSEKELVKVIATYIKKFGFNMEESLGILKEIESHHGILMPVSVREYSFSHLTFQEYFTASYLIDTRRENLVFKYINDPSWYEIFGIIATLLEDSTDFLNDIMDKKTGDEFSKLKLAAYCISGEVSISIDTKRKLVSELLNALKRLSYRVKSFYITRKSSSRQIPGMFFQYDLKNVKNLKMHKEKIIDFISVLNCLANIFSISFHQEIISICTPFTNRKYFTAIKYLLKCKHKNMKIRLYSNVILESGIELPIDIGIFDKSVENYLSEEEIGISVPIKLTILSHDRIGFLADVVSAIQKYGCNILNATSETNEDKMVESTFTIGAYGNIHTKKILSELINVKGIINVWHSEVGESLEILVKREVKRKRNQRKLVEKLKNSIF
jgi:hypothetical protein